MRGQAEATSKWSVLPPTSGRHVPWSWMSESEQESEILDYGLRD
jgi:hypothetical protein